MAFLGGLVLLFIVVAPIWVVVVVARQRRDLGMLRERLAMLEARIVRVESAPVPGAEPVEPAPVVTPASPPPLPTPRPLPVPPAVPVRALLETVVPSTPADRIPAVDAGPRARPESDRSGLEELVGSVWLQNVGSVLVLLGVFFLILWGYTTGRFGPGVLVTAGAVLGVTLAWRGDRLARSLPPFGHALIGVGLGVVYLSLYLGHFTLHVLPWAAAFALLAMVAFGSVLVGLRYRVQTIAALGVLGAFVPQLMAAWIPLQGFTMSAPGMLGYLAAVDGVVFLLAARAGWSSLDLVCLFLSAVTWIAQFHEGWSWWVQGGLSLLFIGLGLSPLPRLTAREATVRPIDLAVIALAPLCLIAASLPLLSAAAPGASAMLLLTLAAIYLAAALWADARRSERDLWRPLTGAAVLFATAGLERALGRDTTPMAWCVEGTLLMWLGLRERGRWLRGCGYAVLGLGVFMLLLIGHEPGDWQQTQWPGFYAAGVRRAPDPIRRSRQGRAAPWQSRGSASPACPRT